MKVLILLAFCAMASMAALAALLPHQQAPLVGVDNWDEPPEVSLIQLSEGEPRWVTDEQKWALKLEGINFMDITAEAKDNSFQIIHPKSTVSYPSKLAYKEVVRELANELSERTLRVNLAHFSNFHTRYYKSSTGIVSATWLYDQINKTIIDSGAHEFGVKVEKFAHPWGQFSIIATIPGQSDKTVVVGAHQDSINLLLPSILAAPGADDDGSGTVTILEAMRVLLMSDEIAHGNATNTLEFHWFSAEEGGLLGSQAIFSDYKKKGRDVKAMLQQDMTGYSKGTRDAGEEESVGVITDHVDEALTEFVKQVVGAYCDIPYVLTKCGYACSDHASASKYGYPSSFVMEAEMQYTNKKIHSTDDKTRYLSFRHMMQHVRMTLGFAYELAFAEL
ncbi:Leucine aminopeptidase 1 [Arachnomyces sp. PD_36]|nr:Leucine aminopeptidase 1 [Arachnomyces sp. PD_36]